MKTLLEKAKIDKPKLRRTLMKVTAENLSRLSEPCYYPSLKKQYFEFLRICSLTEKDVKDFTKRRWVGRKEAKFLLHNDPKTNFYIFLMQYSITERDQTSYQTAMIFFTIRHYTDLLYKHIKFCNESLFKYTLEHLAKTHLFSRERTIPNALHYLAQEMIRKYTRDLKENDLDRISKFIQEVRHRISQSMKSFAAVYYKASKEGIVGLKTQPIPGEDEEDSYQYQTLEKSIKVIDDVARKITVYKFVDKRAQLEARSISKISSEFANVIPTSITNVKYTDNIRIALRLFTKDLKNIDMICGKGYYGYVKKLITTKRTISTSNFKQQINILLLKVLEDMKYKEKYELLTSQAKTSLNLFLAYYLTTTLRNGIC